MVEKSEINKNKYLQLHDLIISFLVLKYFFIYFIYFNRFRSRIINLVNISNL